MLYETIVSSARTPDESDLREALYEIVRMEREPIGFWNPQRWLHTPLVDRAKQIARQKFDEGEPRALRERVPFIALRCVAFSERSSIDDMKPWILEEVTPVFSYPVSRQRHWLDFYERKLGAVKSPVVSLLTRQPFDVAWAYVGGRRFVRPAKPFGHTEAQKDAWRASTGLPRFGAQRGFSVALAWSPFVAVALAQGAARGGVWLLREALPSGFVWSTRRGWIAAGKWIAEARPLVRRRRDVVSRIMLHIPR